MYVFHAWLIGGTCAREQTKNAFARDYCAEVPTDYQLVPRRGRVTGGAPERAWQGWVGPCRVEGDCTPAFLAFLWE